MTSVTKSRLARLYECFMQRVAMPASTVRIRVLIVEDDEHYARALKELLNATSAGLEITGVTTIDEACLRVDTGTVDLVLLDLGLPDADGLEALERLRDCVAEIPVIVLTARSDEQLALAALNKGAEDYLVKDLVDQRMLIRSMRYALERHRGIRDLARVSKELQLANAALEKLTLLDPLTELLNRRGLQQALSREIQRLDRENIEDVLVLLVDIDDFKRVNDSFGHAVGDVALQEVAERLRGCVRAIDYACRVGGDEFLLLLPNADPAEAGHIAERTRVSIATTTIQHSSGTLRLTASVAAMMLRPDTPSIDELMAKAHQLLRRSKQEGKNRVVYEEGEFDDLRRDDAHENLCTDLAQGKHLRTVKQPIYRLSDEKAVAYEFLSRYSNGVFEMPENFFRICAERNVLTLVDHHCLRAAVRAATTLGETVRFHINLFPSTLIAVPPEHLLASFPQPVPPDTYCLEISEQQIIGDPSYLLEPVQTLRAAGLLIAIDDVGFGNSCLESLILLEPNLIKIDKRCITGLATDRPRIDWLRRYVTLAETLRSELVAEGVESRTDLGVLRELNVEYAQGFLWGKPA